MTGSAHGVAHFPLLTADPTLRCPDITQAREVLGWEPSVALADGLQCTVDYFRELRESAMAGTPTV